jgi:riboflavin synthase alpha subunit
VFTGIVREVGSVASVEGGAEGVRIEIEAPVTAASGVAPGDSVAINGCCLTIVSTANGRLAFEAVPETLSRTALKQLTHGSRVNLEPALRAGDPLGGHYVQGHVDGVGSVRSTTPEGDGLRIWIDAPSDILRYVVDKGSITLQGASLTIAGLDDEGFAVALIPHTLAETTLGQLIPGDPVNLEADVLAKYVERLLLPS